MSSLLQVRNESERSNEFYIPSGMDPGQRVPGIGLSELRSSYEYVLWDVTISDLSSACENISLCPICPCSLPC